MFSKWPQKISVLPDRYSVKSSLDLERASCFNLIHLSLCFLILTQHLEELDNFFMFLE